ncbi:hypothetical protein, partial [Ursidibacter sp. B-7004-1]
MSTYTVHILLSDQLSPTIINLPSGEISELPLYKDAVYKVFDENGNLVVELDGASLEENQSIFVDGQQKTAIRFERAEVPFADWSAVLTGTALVAGAVLATQVYKKVLDNNNHNSKPLEPQPQPEP